MLNLPFQCAKSTMYALISTHLFPTWNNTSPLYDQAWNWLESFNHTEAQAGFHRRVRRTSLSGERTNTTYELISQKSSWISSTSSWPHCIRLPRSSSRSWAMVRLLVILSWSFLALSAFSPKRARWRLSLKLQKKKINCRVGLGNWLIMYFCMECTLRKKQCQHKASRPLEIFYIQCCNFLANSFKPWNCFKCIEAYRLRSVLKWKIKACIIKTHHIVCLHTNGNQYDWIISPAPVTWIRMPFSSSVMPFLYHCTAFSLSPTTPHTEEIRHVTDCPLYCRDYTHKIIIQQA